MSVSKSIRMVVNQQVVHLNVKLQLNITLRWRVKESRTEHFCN